MKKYNRMRRTVAALLWLLLLLPLSGCVTLIAAQYASGTPISVEGGTVSAVGNRPLADIAEQEYRTNGGVAGGGEKYWNYWDRSVEQWCCDFVYYCADQAQLVGADKPFGAHTAGCIEAWYQLKENGAQMFAVDELVPAPGDIVFFYSTGGGCATSVDNPQHLAHIGIVVDYTNAGLSVVEGNCGGNGSARNYVARNTYTNIHGQCWSGAAIYGFARIQTGGQPLVDMVKAFEGFTLYPTWDYAQYTVGYGTACPPDKLEVYRETGIPEADAQALLAEHLQMARTSVQQFVQENNLLLSPYCIDALTSLTFNLGSGWMTAENYRNFRATLCREDISDLALVQAFAQLSHAGGEILPALVNRRICEAYLWLTGQYITDCTQSGYGYTIVDNAVQIQLAEGE